MMKIALCLSGQARTWKKCFENWKQNLLNHPARFDFFIHFWDYNTMPRQVWTRNVSGNTIRFEDVSLSQEERDEITSTLKPVSCVFEPKVETPHDHYAVENRIAWWTVDQFRSMAKAAHLKRMHEVRESMSYDLVIRMRSDLFFTRPVQIPVVPAANTIYITHPKWDTEWNAYRVSDIFFMANSPSYDQASAFHDHMPFIDAADVSGDRSRIGFPPELALYYHYKSSGLQISPMWPDIKVMRGPEYIAMKGRLDHYECS